MANIGHNSRRGILGLRWSYNNVDKDPEVDVMRTAYQKVRITESNLAVVAGVALSTVKNMFGGKTRRPQHLTYTKLAAALGKKYMMVDDRPIDYETEVPKARQEFRAYRALRAKKKARKQKKKTNGHGG